MRYDEGIQLRLFDTDKYEVDNQIILIPQTKTHLEFTSLPSPENVDSKYCITEIGGYGGISLHKWLVIGIKDRVSSNSEIFDSMVEATNHIATLTRKKILFRHNGS